MNKTSTLELTVWMFCLLDLMLWIPFILACFAFNLMYIGVFGILAGAFQYYITIPIITELKLRIKQNEEVEQ